MSPTILLRRLLTQPPCVNDRSKVQLVPYRNKNVVYGCMDTWVLTYHLALRIVKLIEPTTPLVEADQGGPVAFIGRRD